MPEVSLPLGCAEGETVRRLAHAYVFAGGNCQKMERTKKSHPVVGLIIFIVLGYLVYHVAYFAIQ